MDYYSKSIPNLIVPKMRKNIYKLVTGGSTNIPINEKISNFFYNTYESYLKDHKLLFFFILIIILFLFYRYITYSKEKFDGNLNLLSDLSYEQTKRLYYNDQPHFNPLYSVKQQREAVNYPPEPYPLYIPNRGMTNFTFGQIPVNAPVAKLDQLNTPIYNYDNILPCLGDSCPRSCGDNGLSYYNGSYDTYKNAKDTNILNPLDFSNNFNTNTGNFITPMTRRNNEIINEFQNNVDIKNNNLLNAMTEYDKDPDYHIDLPYST